MLQTKRPNEERGLRNGSRMGKRVEGREEEGRKGKMINKRERTVVNGEWK